MKSPLITMSAVTGQPTDREIFTYLKELKENGIEQVMIYPRSGCEVEYMSEKWFETVACFLKNIKQLNMTAWLYDDFNWPSGDAAGKVSAREEFRLKSIRIRGEETGRISNYSNHNSEVFGVKFFPDVLSHKAMDYFIACTHEKYYERFREYFGTVITAIFTDEPSISYCCYENDIPYYVGMEEDYETYCGRDFEADMKAAYGDFCRICMELVFRQFKKCFADKIAQWCEQHGILMTGHLLYDDAPFISTRSNGNLLKILSSFTLPGIDEISTNPNREMEWTLLGAAEYAGRNKGAVAELFALGPCDMTYAKKRQMIFLMASFKIDHYLLAVSPMDLRGNMMIKDYFNCFTADQPDFAGTRLLTEDARIAAQYAARDYIPDVYIRYPVSLCAAHIVDKPNDQPFINLVNRLTHYQVQWKYVSEEEECGQVPVIEFSDQFEYILGTTVTADLEEICGRFLEHTIVREGNGSIPESLFVRRFVSGDIMVLNLCDQKRSLRIGKMRLDLEGYGVWISDLDMQKRAPARKENLTVPFDIHYCNQNLIRTMYINSQKKAEIICDGDKEIRLAVRKGQTAAMGDVVLCNQICDGLPRGLRELYGASEKISLSSGIHIIESEDDYKYMPSVFVSGDFSAETVSGDVCSIILRERKKQCRAGEQFCDYGKIEFSARVEIPEGAVALELGGTALYTCVYVEGALIGERICPPYVYQIDQKMWGKKRNLKIVQYSSLAPIFGDVAYYDLKSERVSWKGVPAPGKTLFGFQTMNWICEGKYFFQ